MIFEDALDIGKMYHEGFKRSIKDVEEIVLHCADGFGIRKWMRKPDPDLDASKMANWEKGIGFCQLGIEKSGVAFKLVDPYTRGLYHSNAQAHDMKTIGIEIEKLKYGEMTPMQFNALINMCHDIFEVCDIKRIVSHDYNRAKWNTPPIKPKPCPGKFPIDAFTANIRVIKNDIEVFI